MMNCYPALKANDGWGIFAQPLAADFEGARDLRFRVQERIQIAALAQLDPPLAIARDPVRLCRENQRSLALCREFPGCEESEIPCIARIGKLLFPERRLLNDETVQERSPRVKVQSQSRR